MANKLYEESSVQAIADAIRAKNGSSDTYTISEMASAVSRLPSGGVRTCRVVVGTSTAGWTAEDCDYLCDGVDDQVEINQAIQSAKGVLHGDEYDGYYDSGLVVLLSGTYNVSSGITLDCDVSLHGETDKEKVSILSNAKNNTIVTVTGDHSTGYMCSISNIHFADSTVGYSDLQSISTAMTCVGIVAKQDISVTECSFLYLKNGIDTRGNDAIIRFSDFYGCYLAIKSSSARKHKILFNKFSYCLSCTNGNIARGVVIGNSVWGSLDMSDQKSFVLNNNRCIYNIIAMNQLGEYPVVDSSGVTTNVIVDNVVES